MVPISTDVTTRTTLHYYYMHLVCANRQKVKRAPAAVYSVFLLHAYTIIHKTRYSSSTCLIGRYNQRKHPHNNHLLNCKLFAESCVCWNAISWNGFAESEFAETWFAELLRRLLPHFPFSNYFNSVHDPTSWSAVISFIVVCTMNKLSWNEILNVVHYCTCFHCICKSSDDQLCPQKLLLISENLNNVMENWMLSVQ